MNEFVFTGLLVIFVMVSLILWFLTMGLLKLIVIVRAPADSSEGKDSNEDDRKRNPQSSWMVPSGGTGKRYLPNQPSE
jgi:hypothetical protein